MTKPAGIAFDRWCNDPGKAEVVPHVMAHVTLAVYTLSPSAVEQVCLTTAHALGQVKRTVAESVKTIVDWHPSFAFTHTLHYAVETLGSLPTWQTFLNFVRTDPQAKAMLWDPVVEHVMAVHQAAGGPSLKSAWDSMGWRVGNAYYSFLREIYIVVNLRDAGLDVRMHPLADALSAFHPASRS
ncbi:hypothetical protein [Nonomuraea maritima]|uniref:hypothetical protein n=1 Tax=Nonomuraea maritima TaxID=683260 RepID=UPI00115FBB52|nr:hypothetical protein [Nonomuraea maritima]